MYEYTRLVEELEEKGVHISLQGHYGDGRGEAPNGHVIRGYLYDIPRYADPYAECQGTRIEATYHPDEKKFVWEDEDVAELAAAIAAAPARGPVISVYVRPSGVINAYDEDGEYMIVASEKLNKEAHKKVVADDGYHVTQEVTIAGETVQVTSWCGRHPCYSDEGATLAVRGDNLTK